MASAKDLLSSRLRRHRRTLDTLVAFFWVFLFLIPYALKFLTPYTVKHFNFAPPLAQFSIRPFQAIDTFFSDELALHGRLTPSNPDIIFLGIDDASMRLDALDPEVVRHDPALSNMSIWPWPRQVYASIYDRLTAAGARLVLFDILFQVPKPEDAALKAALDRHPDRFVLGCNFVPLPIRRADGDFLEQLASPADTIIPQTAPPDPRVAFVNFWPDSDGSIRQAVGSPGTELEFAL